MPVLPLYAQGTVRSLHTLKIPCPPFSRRRPDSWWHGNRWCIIVAEQSKWWLWLLQVEEDVWQWVQPEPSAQARYLQFWWPIPDILGLSWVAATTLYTCIGELNYIMEFFKMIFESIFIILLPLKIQSRLTQTNSTVWWSDENSGSAGFMTTGQVTIPTISADSANWKGPGGVKNKSQQLLVGDSVMCKAAVVENPCGNFMYHIRH